MKFFQFCQDLWVEFEVDKKESCEILSLAMVLPLLHPRNIERGIEVLKRRQLLSHVKGLSKFVSSVEKINIEYKEKLDFLNSRKERSSSIFKDVIPQLETKLEVKKTKLCKTFGEL